MTTFRRKFPTFQAKSGNKPSVQLPHLTLKQGASKSSPGNSTINYRRIPNIRRALPFA